MQCLLKLATLSRLRYRKDELHTTLTPNARHPPAWLRQGVAYSGESPAYPGITT